MTIPQDIIERLKELRIEEVADKLGIVVKRHRAICFMQGDRGQVPVPSFISSKLHKMPLFQQKRGQAV